MMASPYAYQDICKDVVYQSPYISSYHLFFVKYYHSIQEQKMFENNTFVMSLSLNDIFVTRIFNNIIILIF